MTRRLQSDSGTTVSGRTFWIGAAGVFSLALLVRALYLWQIGMRTPPDTATYVSACQSVVADPTLLVTGAVGIDYVGFVAPFCTFWLITDGWLFGWVLVQVFLSSVTASILYLAGIRLFSARAGLFAGVLFALLFDAFRWTIYVLSETTFLLTLGVSLLAFARYLDAQTIRSRIVCYGAILWMGVTRPVGLPVFVGWVLWDFGIIPSRRLLRQSLTKWQAAALGVVAASTAAVFALTNRLEFLTESVILTTWERGWLFWNGTTPIPFQYPFELTPTEGPFVFLIRNAHHVLALVVLKTAVFYWPVMPYLLQSPIWLMWHLGTYVPMLLFGAYGFVSLARHRRPEFALLLIPVAMLTLVPVATFLDYAWRYRVPIEPAFVLAAGYGATRVPWLQRFADRLWTAVPTRVTR